MKLFKEGSNVEELNSYIDASTYWKKRSTSLNIPNKRDVKWVFAENEDMASVICMFRGWYIICTESSHKNIMNNMEGKGPNKRPKPTAGEMLAETGAHIDYIDDDLIQMLNAVPDY